MLEHPSLTVMGKKGKEASLKLARASTAHKNRALTALTEILSQSKDAILSANRQDMEAAVATGMEPALLDRLDLQNRLEAVIRETEKIIALPDPVGENLEEKVLPNGLKLSKRRTPIGVIGVIYESRPNVTVDVAALTIKTGNAAILRGGSESLRTNSSLVHCIRRALEQAQLPADAVQFIDSPDRQLVQQLLTAHQYVDMIIPRGGAGLHRFCRENSTIPVITGGIGICHLFVDRSADLKKALEVVHNAKTQRPTVCNALDTLLVHEAVAAAFIPQVVKTLGDVGVFFRLDPIAQRIYMDTRCQPAGQDDWDSEWLSLVLGIRVVQGMDEAITHIQEHSTGHSDGILTQDKVHAARFIDEVDSAAVYHNASTRFTDGGEFGLGAEVAVSTQKLHARGPMGLKELTTYKWIVEGNYHIRQ